MIVYLTFWGAGGLVAVAIAMLVLRQRHALGPASVLALMAAAYGFLYGAKLQYRLRDLPLSDALVVPPSELFSPGFHVPLAAVMATLFAVACSLLLRAPWRSVLDGMAVGGSALMPIGRIGCLLSGCCGGVVCGAWARSFCPRFLPGSEVYSLQVNAGLISADAATSLPVHPLQLYFGALGLALLGLHLWMLGRRLPAGSNAAAMLLLYPLGQLALEQIRAVNPVQSNTVMTTVLWSTVVADVVVVALAVCVWALRPRPAVAR